MFYAAFRFFSCHWHATIVNQSIWFLWFWGIFAIHTHGHTSIYTNPVVTVPAVQGVEKTHICSVAREWRECPVRAVISREGLLPVQLCLTGTTTLVNELFTEDTCTYTHTHSREHRWHRYFFPWCVFTVAERALFYKGRNRQCYHVREEKHPDG